MKRRTIGQLAKEAGVNVETVRFYERRGILPKPPEPAEGWREYSDAALATLRYIRLGQQLGFKLSEIKRLQSLAKGKQQAFCESVRSATREKIRSVEEQIQQLEAVHKELVDFLGRCSAKDPKEQCPIYQSFGLAEKLAVPRRGDRGRAH